MKKISGNKNELVLRASNANQVIYAYGANSSVDDDVKYDKDSVEDREYILPQYTFGELFVQKCYKSREKYDLK
jgi:hypothetical protein